MAEHRYLVTTHPGRAELREKGSRFVCWVEPAADAETAAARLAEIVQSSPDATHHCWARRLGLPAEERAVDDGEPTGTAGVPMLQVLRGAEVSDTLAVVARWFGGTKLGKGGLARAYAAAVREALAAASVGERLRYEVVALEVPYDRFGAVKRLVRPPDVVLGAATYGDVVRCELHVVPPARSLLLDELASLGVSPRPRQ